MKSLTDLGKDKRKYVLNPTDGCRPSVVYCNPAFALTKRADGDENNLLGFQQ